MKKLFIFYLLSSSLIVNFSNKTNAEEFQWDKWGVKSSYTQGISVYKINSSNHTNELQGTYCLSDYYSTGVTPNDFAVGCAETIEGNSYINPTNGNPVLPSFQAKK